MPTSMKHCRRARPSVPRPLSSRIWISSKPNWLKAWRRSTHARHSQEEATQEVDMTRMWWFVVPLAAGLFAGAPVNAADTVKIGVIYPLTGNAASAGQSAKDAVELGAEIVNNAIPELKNLPLGATAGLPNLGGAKVELISADHQGNPQVGQQQTLRLITQEKVAAMLGSYHSSVSLVATAVAERQGIPFLVSDSVALNITGRGFKWVFRTGPIASDFATAYTQFLNDLKKAGRPINTIAIVNENTEYGTSVAGSINEAAKRAGITVAAQIPYNANSTDVSGQVLQLKQLKPDT